MRNARRVLSKREMARDGHCTIEMAEIANEETQQLLSIPHEPCCHASGAASFWSGGTRRQGTVTNIKLVFMTCFPVLKENTSGDLSVSDGRFRYEF